MKTMEQVRADLPNLVTPLPGPKAKTIISRDNAVISTSYTRGYPLVAARGEGAIVEDVDGNRFLDCCAGIAVVSTGHCHPKVVEAIREQAGKLIHMSGTDFYYENMVKLAERRRRSFHSFERRTRPSASISAIRAPKRWKPRSSSLVITPAADSSSRFSADSTAEPWDRCR